MKISNADKRTRDLCYVFIPRKKNRTSISNRNMRLNIIFNKNHIILRETFLPLLVSEDLFASSCKWGFVCLFLSVRICLPLLVSGNLFASSCQWGFVCIFLSARICLHLLVSGNLFASSCQ